MLQSGYFYLLLISGISAYSANAIFPFQNSSLEWEERLDDLISRLTVDEMLLQIQRGGGGERDGPAPAIPRLGIRPFQWNNECIRGYVGADPTTSFPQALGLAASFDSALLHAVGEVGSIEARARHGYSMAHNDYRDHTGIICFSPVVNLMVHPFWGRNQETYGEDPYLTGTHANAFVRGLQGDHPRYLRTVSTCKHFLAHTGPENLPESRHTFDAHVSEVDMRMSYMPHFEACIRGDGSSWSAGAFGIMCAYSSINGVPACVSEYLPLSMYEWGFRGMMISDEGALEDLVTTHKYFKDYEDAAVASLYMGVNIELGPNWRKPVYDFLNNAYAKGRVSRVLIESRVRALFNIRLRLGEFELTPSPSLSRSSPNGHHSHDLVFQARSNQGDAEPFPFNYSLDVIQSEAHRNLSVHAAMKSFVLLKNEGNFLPLSARLASLTLVGPFANETENIFGDYSPNVEAQYIVTVVQGLKKLLANPNKLVLESGCSDGPRCRLYDRDRLMAAVRAEKKLVIATVGTGQVNEQEGHDRSSYDLPNEQQKLLNDVMSSVSDGVPIVLLVFSASPVNIVFASAANQVPAILQCTFPAQSTGTAIYNVLTRSAGSDSNPAARLPYTWYLGAAPLPSNADYNMENKTYRYLSRELRQQNVLYPFGFGLSYSNFHYESVQVPAMLNGPREDANFTMTITLSSLGPYDGDEVVQVYAEWPTDVYANYKHVPLLQLIHFERVTMAANSKRTLSFSVRVKTLRVWDTDLHKYVFPLGKYTLSVGGQQPYQTFQVPSNILSTFINFT